jgi:diguanylate cyclase (GGDEF)-like protein
MNEPRKPHILILTDRESLAHGWAEMLRPIAAAVWLGRERLPPDARPDVIVADAAAEAAGWGCGVVRIGGPDLSSGEPGGSGRPDVHGSGQGLDDIHLPEDVAARELMLACRLTARISHLQRQLDAEEALRRRFRDEAMTDPLTGLPNRRAWNDVLQQRLAGGGQQTLCLAILDLDHFKQINDAHGHAVGDQVLRQAGETAVASLRQDDFVARLGGDEFGLLLAVRDGATAGVVVERLRTALPFRLTTNDLPVVTASVGYSVATRDEPRSPDAFYASADEALRSAKQHGRDRTMGGAGDFAGAPVKTGDEDDGDRR